MCTWILMQLKTKLLVTSCLNSTSVKLIKAFGLMAVTCNNNNKVESHIWPLWFVNVRYQYRLNQSTAGVGPAVYVKTCKVIKCYFLFVQNSWAGLIMCWKVQRPPGDSAAFCVYTLMNSWENSSLGKEKRDSFHITALSLTFFSVAIKTIWNKLSNNWGLWNEKQVQLW